MSILLVDDSGLMREQLRADLEEAAFRVTEADSGAAALAEIRRGFAPSLVISDINMPDMDGLTFLEGLHDALGERVPPVFVLSAERSEDARRRARALHVRAWIVKPYEPETLIAAVRKVLSHDV